MKVLHVNTTDRIGGAARGAYWLHKALRGKGIDSRMLVAVKTVPDDEVICNLGRFGKAAARAAWEIESVPLRFYRQTSGIPFTSGRIGSFQSRGLNDFDPDIVNLHWIVRGFLGFNDLRRFRRPIVWTLRDMWPLTGGCHHALECERYKHTSGCHSCPVLGSHHHRDLSHRLWQGKFRAVSAADVTIVAISRWLAQCAAESPFFKGRRIEIVHNAVDHHTFTPQPKRALRSILGIPENAQVVAFGAVDATSSKIKGFDLLRQSLRRLANSGYGTDVVCLVFGSDRPQDDRDADLGVPTRYLGRINDDAKLAAIYGAADVMAVPSLAEAFGKTAMEALACGTPVVSFDTSGLKDIVEHERNGYRAKCFDCEDFAAGLAWVLADQARWLSLSRRAREKVEQEFIFERQTQRYVRLYNDIIARSKP